MQSANAPETTSVQRNVVVRMNSGRRTEDETGAANVVNHGRLVRLVDLVPQPAHVHIDKVGLRHDFVVPDFLEQHRARQQLVFATHHVFEQAKLARKKLDHTIVPFGGAREEIKLERTDFQRRLAALRGPAKQRLNPRDQLDDGKRLGQIVVAATAQAAYAV